MSAARALDIYKAIDFQLRIESGPDAGRAFRIYPPKISIGRDLKNDVTLSDPKTSRIQCKIEFGEHIVLTDTSRRKTSLINGQKFSTHKIIPNDIISFGDTRVKFVARSKSNLPSIPKSGPKHVASPTSKKTTAGGRPFVAGSSPAKNRMPLYVIVGLVLAGVLYLKMAPTLSKKPQETLTTSQDLENQAEESRIFQQKLQETYKEKLKTNQNTYQMEVQQHFIRGFRDFQTENYGRAIQAFGAAIAKDPNHVRAKRYMQISQQLKEEQIDKHLFNGEEFRTKLMYERCAAEFEKVLILLNRPKNPKYILAKERHNECLILKSGGSL